MPRWLAGWVRSTFRRYSPEGRRARTLSTLDGLVVAERDLALARERLEIHARSLAPARRYPIHCCSSMTSKRAGPSQGFRGRASILLACVSRAATAASRESKLLPWIRP